MHVSLNYIVANWKQNARRDMLSSWLLDVNDELKGEELLLCSNLVICPPLPYLSQLDMAPTWLSRGAQVVSPFQGGAYTGEVSAHMLREFGVEFALVGHSERRLHFAESAKQRFAQLQALWAAGITPILCIGESSEDHALGMTQKVLSEQLSEALLSQPVLGPLILAYEPVFAIGSGNPLSAEIAQQVHAFLRMELRRWYKDGQQISILYGGSVNSRNVSDYAIQADIDGVLVGGASLDASCFLALARGFALAKNETSVE